MGNGTRKFERSHILLAGRKQNLKHPEVLGVPILFGLGDQKTQVLGYIQSFKATSIRSSL